MTIESHPGDDSTASKMFRELEPFFGSKHIIYVDVGAYRGDLYRSLLQTKIQVREAHLIEPNPRSFRLLTESLTALKGPPPFCHNLALGATAGCLQLRDIDAMRRAISTTPTEGSAADVTMPGTCEVETTTLDTLVRSFGQPKISILKIDVEGSEIEVLTGAHGLLANHAIDVIHVVARMNPVGQPTNYQAIQDWLHPQGYPLFQICEQKHKSLDDGPLLQSATLSFMSESFASLHPYQLLTDLMAGRKEIMRLTEALKAGQDGIARGVERFAWIEARLGEQMAATARARTESEAAQTKCETQAAVVRVEEERLRQKAAALEAKLSEVVKYCRKLEQDYARLLVSRTWRAMEPVRWIGRTLKHRRPPEVFVPRLAAILGKPLPNGPFVVSGNPQKKSVVQSLEDKLWGGFSKPARADLEALKTSPFKGKGTRASSAWVLARWCAARGDFNCALENVQLMIEVDSSKRMTPRVLLLEADCLMRLGAAEDARARLRKGLRDKPDNPDLCLAMSNSYIGTGAEDIRLEWINRIFLRMGLQRLVRIDPEGDLDIANLAAPGAPAAAGGDLPKVSVIVPVFDAGTTLAFALRGLQTQTWRNLEILVVDDCSPDDTHAIAEAIAAADPRVRVLRQSENLGSYAARNAGLRAATGDFVTTHDADDWSHPQKIETQIRHMLAHPELAATFSNWVRCTAGLRIGWLHRAWGGFIAKNMSSIMLRRESFEALGGWDVVRGVGDTELLRRVEQLWSPAAVAAVLDGAPLAFSLHREGSETLRQATHIRTMLYGARREYNEAGAYWREHVRTREELHFPLDDAGHRPFPAPISVLPAPIRSHVFDLLFVSDFCFRGGAFVSTLNYIRAARAAGLSVGVFHWRRYDLDVTQALNPIIRSLAQDSEIRIVAPGEPVQATTVVFGYPVILVQWIDLFPAVTYKNLVVIVNQMAAYLHGGGDPQYDPQVIRDNLHGFFGSEGIWVPISGLVQRLMRADPRYPAPDDIIWTPLIDTGTWCGHPLRWRGADGRQPVIGRHARDHYTKWPSSAVALREAYCADRPCAVELMGGARKALAVIGAAPANWTVHAFGASESIDFLRGLDFFVHYPHEQYIEEFGRAVLEALAVGLPAVLPPVFRETFGEAASYAEPSEVWNRIAALWADEAAYLDQARRGRDFVQANSDWSQFPNRLARTVSADLPKMAAAP